MCADKQRSGGTLDRYESKDRRPGIHLPANSPIADCKTPSNPTGSNDAALRCRHPPGSSLDPLLTTRSSSRLFVKLLPYIVSFPTYYIIRVPVVNFGASPSFDGRPQFSFRRELSFRPIAPLEQDPSLEVPWAGTELNFCGTGHIRHGTSSSPGFSPVPPRVLGSRTASNGIRHYRSRPANRSSRSKST